MVPSRPELLLDAAIDVLGSQGARALTHRAVDAAAGMPAGSTANYYKTRDALIGAVADRFAERDRAAWEAIADVIRPSGPGELAKALIAYARRALDADRATTVARFGLFVEAALRPELRQRLAAPAGEIRLWAARWLREAGSADPQRDCAAILDHLDGAILHQLAFPGPAEVFEAAVERAVQNLITR